MVEPKNVEACQEYNDWIRVTASEQRTKFIARLSSIRGQQQSFEDLKSETTLHQAFDEILSWITDTFYGGDLDGNILPISNYARTYGITSLIFSASYNRLMRK